MFGWIVCLFKCHDWMARGLHDGDYCSRCGQWEYDR